jgi:type I restriction enzyme S subunit
MRLKHLARHIDERLVTPEMDLMSVSKIRGVVPRSAISDAEGRADDISHYKTCRPGDLVINRMSAYQGALGIAKQVGAVSPDYMVLRFGKDFDPAFAAHFFKSHQTISLMTSLVRGIGSVDSGSVRTPRLSWSDLGNAPISIPSVSEQVAIASFLDRETAQIDALITKQQQLIETLAERRKAVITRAVTRGLDPTVPMKDSGVEWLGEIPAHWDAIQIKWLSPVRRGSSPRPIDDEKYFEESGEWAWVRIADVSRSEGRLLETLQKLSPLGSSLSTKILPGELFVSIAGTVGKPCIAEIKCCIHDGFTYFPHLKMNREFLFRIFESGNCYAGLGKMGTQLNLNTDTIGSIRVPVPPGAEQEAIATFLKDKIDELEDLSLKANQIIDLLKERRQALISAAVTGKIDVRGEGL